MEWLYLPQLLKELSKYLDDSWRVIFTGENDLPNLEGHDPEKVVVFQISDERYGVPNFSSRVKAVFKNYVKSDKEAENVYPIPQGPMTGFLHLPYRKPEDRSIDVFFSGNWHTSRRCILDGLKQRLSDKYRVVFLENNAATMVQQTYSHFLMDSKINCDLHGGICAETFRYYESLAAGCATLSYQKPDNWIYRKNPTIVPNWDNLDEVAETIINLLEDKEKLSELSTESAKFYEKRYSPEYVVKNHILPYLFKGKKPRKLLV
jgi:glycosyltransferase involved in cell wall biosynthesis